MYPPHRCDHIISIQGENLVHVTWIKCLIAVEVFKIRIGLN